MLSCGYPAGMAKQVLIGCVAATAVVTLASAGCATRRAEVPSATPIATDSEPKGSSPSNQSGGTTVNTGMVTSKAVTVHWAEPITVDGYDVTLTNLRADVSHTLLKTEAASPRRGGWNLTLGFIVTDKREGRWSRLAAPMRVLAVLDEDGRVVDGATKTEEDSSSSTLAFHRGGRYSMRASRSIKVEMVPEYLPQQISSIQCEIPMEVVSETRTFSLPLTESRDEELMPGLSASLRLVPGEGPNASRFRRFNIIIEQETERLPMLRSVVYIAANGRSRELTDESRVDRLEGKRRCEYSLTTDPESGPGIAILKLEVAIGVTPVTVPFEFRNIPVGPTRRP